MLISFQYFLVELESSVKLIRESRGCYCYKTNVRASRVAEVLVFKHVCPFKLTLWQVPCTLFNYIKQEIQQYNSYFHVSVVMEAKIYTFMISGLQFLVFATSSFFSFPFFSLFSRRQEKLLRTVQKPSSPASAGKLHALSCSLQPEKENIKDKLLRNIKYLAIWIKLQRLGYATTKSG